MNGALLGIRVIDFGQYLAGPLVAMLLADLGAYVIRVDPPGGPRWRHHANAILQRGKRSIVLDLKQTGDLSISRRLLESADIVVESFRPGVLDRLGLGPAAVAQTNPRLIYCSIPGFASDDPRAALPALEGVVSSASGIYFTPSWTPELDEPVFNPLPLSSSFAAMRAAQCIIAALIARERSGRGQRIEVPLFDASFEVIGLGGDRFPGREPTRRDVSAYPWANTNHFECADGIFVHLSWLEGHQLDLFARRFGSPDWFADGLVNEEKVRSDLEVSNELHRRLANVFKTKTAAEWARIANPESDLAECLTTADWLNREEQARATNAVISMPDPEFGNTRQAGYPITLAGTTPQAQGPRHALNADSDAILAELSLGAPASSPAPANAPESGERLPAALDGFRVVDVAQVLAGPTCGRILAEFGADVVKINNPYGRPFAGYHHLTNSGKRTMLLDLKTPEGMDVFWRLIERADVFSMNFLPPAVERLGIGYEEVRRRRPEIIYSAITCYGWDGPRRTHAGHEQLGEAVTGMQVRWGAGFHEPIMQPSAICDYGTGHMAALAVMIGLFHRLRTGEGQFVGASLAQTATFIQTPFMIDHEGRVWDEPAGQQAKGWGPLDRLYRASDRWFYLGAVARAAGNGQPVTDPTPDPHADAVARVAAVEGLNGIEALRGAELEAKLTERFATAPAATWVERLMAAGVGAQIWRNIQEVMEDPWVKAHGLSVERDFPELGRVRTIGPSGQLSLTPLRTNFPAAPPGTHNREILEEIGLSDRYDELVARGVIASTIGPRTAVPT